MSSAALPPNRRPRDPRLDFFRGAGMLIILIAHVPSNKWALWIPARFGFSDATEIFVFCSGLASALAFGAVFAQRGWLMGALRVAHRVWQVYWAHLGVFLVTVALVLALDAAAIDTGKVYVQELYVVPFLEDPARLLPALLTLRYVPGLFDILPMYLVILALIPVIMAAHRAGGTAAAAGLSAGLWLAANLAGWAWTHDGGGALAALGGALQPLNLPGLPGERATWFFNPFAWQIVFFTGFAFGMGWFQPPSTSRALVLAALAVVVLSLPLAWYQLHEGFLLPEGSPLAALFAEAREATRPLWWKQWQGALRYVHFLALAYLAWVAVGEGGRRLREALPLAPRPERRRATLAAFGAVAALLTAPWAYLDVMGDGQPALAVLPPASVAMMGWLSLIHAAAGVTLIWNILPRPWVELLVGPVWLGAVEVLRKVGTQSLAVFMTSIPLSQLLGAALDLSGRNPLSVAAANVFGVAVLIGAAYFVSLMKSQPWRSPAGARPEPRASARTPAE